MRVLGLDLSPHAVACVELDTAFGRFEIRDTYDRSTEDAFSTAPQVIGSLSKTPDKIVTAVPVENSTFRNIHLATRDKKAIKAAVSFELEDDLPFEKENLHFDSVLLSSDSKGSHLHVAAVKKDSFAQYVNRLEQANIDASIVTTEVWAYRSLLTRMVHKDQTQDPSLLIGLEAEKTFFYLHHKDQPVLYREIPFGVRTLEALLTQKLNKDPSDSRKMLFDVGVTQIDEVFSNAVSDILDQLIPELKQTELSGRVFLKTAIAQIHLTGEGALIPGLLNWFEEASGRRTSLFRPLTALSPGQVSYSDLSEIRFAKAFGLALASIPIDKVQPVNLRKKEFAPFSSNDHSVGELLKKIIPYAAITLAVFFATKTIENNYYAGRLEETNETLNKALKGYLGVNSANVIRTKLANPGALKRSIQNDLAQERELAQLFSQNPHSPYQFLKELSNKISKDIVVDLIEFEVGAQNTEPYREGKAVQAQLQFTLSGSSVLSRLTSILEKDFGLKRSSFEEFKKEGRTLIRVGFSGMVGGAQ